MVASGHVPEWPDKIMASALFTLLAGLLAVMHAVMQYADVTFDQDAVNPLYFVPAGWMLFMGLGGVTVGAFAYLHQSWLLTVAAMLLAILSMGLLGAAPLVAILAIWPLIRSFQEGEETRLDHHHVRAHQWPDKAIMASVVLASAGAVTVMNGTMLIMDRVTAPVMPESPVTWGLFSILAGIVGILAGREVFKLRRAWMGWIGSAGLIGAAAFYIVGPALAIVGLIYMALAYREAEFLLHAPDRVASE